MTAPSTIPTVVHHGLVWKLLSPITPRIVRPISGTNIRHVVSPMVPSIKTTGETVGVGVVPRLFGDVLIYIYTVTESQGNCHSMPRKNHTPPHQPLRMVIPCGSKRRFPNERQANEAADYQMLVKPELELSTYKCEFCGGWHLTRQQK